MTLAFLNLGTPEITILLLCLVFIIVVGNYGKNTALGYTGTILLAIFTTPIIAFLVVSVLKMKSDR